MSIIAVDYGTIQGGGGNPEVKQVIPQTLTAGATTWTTLETINEDGLAVCVIIDNSSGMQWQNTTKGTSGSFTDISSYDCGYASFEVSKNDVVKIRSNSSVARHIVVQIVGE